MAHIKCLGIAIPPQASLTVLPTGEWTDTEHLDVWFPTLECIDEAKERESLIDAIVEALCTRPFRRWLEEKWHHAELAVCDVGLLLIFHGILWPAFEIYAAGQVSKKGIANLVPDLHLHAASVAPGGDPGEAADGDEQELI